MSKIEKTGKDVLPIFLVHPFLAIIISYFRHKKIHPVILYPFFFLIGYSFFYKGFSSDLYSYSMEYTIIVNFSFADYVNHIKNLYTTAPQPDAYAITLQFLVSRFTDNFRILIGVAAVIQLHFMLHFFLYVYKLISPNNTASKYAFWIIVFTIPLQTIFGLRFWTAFFIFLYFSIKFLVEKKIIYIFPLLLTPLVHFAFTVPVFFIPVFFIIKYFPNISFLVVFLAIPLSSPVVNYFFNYETQVESIEGRKSYLSEGSAERTGIALDTARFYIKLNTDFPFYFLIAMTILIFFERSWKTNPVFKDILVLALLSAFLALLFREQGSVARYARFFDIYGFILVAFWVNLKEKIRLYSIIKYVLLFILILKIWVGLLRGAFAVMDWQLVFSNAFLIFFNETKTSITDILFFFF